MKALVASLLISLAGVAQTAPQASAETDKDTAKPTATTLYRPGAKTHFPRGGFKFDNSGHPVTGQGSNMSTQALNDTLEAAGVPRH